MKRIFDWTKFIKWKQVVLSELSELITDSVLDAFKKDPPRYVVSDDMEWLHRHIGDDVLDGKDIREILAIKLRRFYAAIRVYHACCPVDFSSYKSNGIQLLNPQDIYQKARTIFSQSNFPKIAPDHLEQAIKDADYKFREGRLFLALDAGHLLEDCGHYFIYGSEYLVVIAANLSGQNQSRDYRMDLRFLGEPALAVVDIPIDFVRERDLLELSGVLLEQIFQDILDGEGCGTIDFTFELKNAVPPSSITSWKFPSRIRDPFTGETFTKVRNQWKSNRPWLYPQPTGITSLPRR